MGHRFINSFTGGNLSIYDAIVAAGLTTNLKLCLDAGDAASYSSGQKWLDLSGNGHDFFRGATSGVDATDPTFNGVAGGLSAAEYFSFDGGDFFQYDTTNEAWMQTLHKDGAVFTILAVVYVVSGAEKNYFFITSGTDASGIGTYAGISGSGKITLFVPNGSVASINATSDGSLATGWHLVAISANENGGASAGFFYLDGAYAQKGSADTWNPAYASPSASSASATARIGSIPLVGSGFQDFNASTSRISGLAMWQGTALSKANLDTLWAMLRGRFAL